MSECTVSPTVLVIFGITGDLSRRKVLPALYSLYRAGKLPEKFAVVGVARRDLAGAGLKQYVQEILETRYPGEEKEIKEFAAQFAYAQGDMGASSTYQRIRETLNTIDTTGGVCSNRLFYLAVAPEHYETVFGELSQAGLADVCSPEEGSPRLAAGSRGEAGWTRIIVEKPFGRDQASAEKLDQLLGATFKEEQIYRIDHYLAKEMLQNILAFRFSNNLFEETWNNQGIERIDIRLHETLGAEDRGAFYDSVGAFRDVGQNHLLQMLALMTMRAPESFSADAIRARRAEALAELIVPDEETAARDSYRAQYEGFSSIAGVATNSETETYFKVQAHLSSPLWRGVPIMLSSGKRLDAARKDIVVTFAHPEPCLCPPEKHLKNRLIFEFEPEERIRIEFWAKKPGFGMELEERVFDFSLREKSTHLQYTEEYAKLLYDCIQGDQTLFASSAELASMWRFTDAILSSWKKKLVPLASYVPDTGSIADEATQRLREKQPHAAGRQETIGVIGLGKMGANIARRLQSKGWRVVGYNRSPLVVDELANEKVIVPAHSLSELVSALPAPRSIWVMVSHEAVDAVLSDLMPFLQEGDTILEGGNSFYKDSIRRAEELQKQGIHFIDIGVSGGPSGARWGASLMIGGDKENVAAHERVFADLAAPGALLHAGKIGAGHFVKMVHNGIEYGMMQSIGEGFEVLKRSPFELDMHAVAELYNRGSVIVSRLVGWLAGAFAKYGSELDDFEGPVAESGEARWTVETAKELGVPVSIIEGSLRFRKESAEHPSYTARVLSALRHEFGGHHPGRTK